MERMQRDTGAVAVEFVLLFPLMMLMLLFFLEFGVVLHSWITVNNAASEAARYAAVGNVPSATAGTCDAGSIEERAVEASSNNLECGDVAIEYQRYSGATVRRGDGVAIHIAHSYSPITGFSKLLNAMTGGAFPATLTMSACADTRLETNLSISSWVDGDSCE